MEVEMRIKPVLNQMTPEIVVLVGCFSLAHFLFPPHEPTAKIKRAKEMLPSNKQ